jgi:SnoaL-like domain
MMESRAVAFARAHLEAWSNHDLDKARGNLAPDVQFFSPAGQLVGVDEYMDAPRAFSSRGTWCPAAWRCSPPWVTGAMR